MRPKEKKLKKQKNRKKGSQGTISIFLVIILVPCIIFTCLFGDISRVELSKAQASAASDLAMYSLMSHYDNELKEYYGLVASCQDIESFYDVTATYFTGMMSAKGVSGEGSQLFLDYLASLKSGNMADFLQVEFTQPATVKEAKNSAMGDNAALIEDSIVEFMKYRGPYEIANNIIDRMENLNILEGVAGAQKDEPIAEARKEYAEAENDMLKKALYLYMATELYTDFYTQKGVPGFEKYKQYETDLGKIARDFSKVTEVITKYYAGTEGIRNVNFPLKNLNAYTDSIAEKNVGTKVKDSSNTIYCINKKDLEKLLKDIDKKKQEAENAASSIAASCSNLPDPTPSFSDVNPAIFCMKVQNQVKSGDLNTLDNAGEWLMKRYAQLNAALNCQPFPKKQKSDKDDEKEVIVDPEDDKDALPDDWKNQIQQAMRQIEATYNSCYAAGGSSDYLQFVSRYRKTAESNVTYSGGMDTITNVIERRYEFQSEYMNGMVRVGDFIEKVRNDFKQIDEDISTQIKNLNVIIDGGSFSYNGNTYFTVSLDSFKSAVLNYSSKRNEWGSAISSSGSDSQYAKNERSEYKGEGEDEGEKFAAKIAKDGGKSVDNFKSRLVNIRNDMLEFQKALKEFKYGGKQVTTLSGRNETIQAGRTVIPKEIDISLSNNEKAAAGYYKSLLTPDASKVYKASEKKSGEAGNNPNLQDDKPNLYGLLEAQFKGQIQKIESEVKENEKRNEQYKKDAEEKKKNANKIESKYLKGKGSNLGASHGGSRVSATTAIGSLISTVNALMNGSGDELRDELYVTEYIMDMFSYSTFNNEGQHRLVAKKKYTLDDFTEDGYPGCTTLWVKEDAKEIPQNQSLTNQPINAAHNQMNLGEVEYVLYGSKNIDKNLETSYKNIFAIRETLNLVSGFQNFYVGSNDTAKAIQGIASAIMAATAGVVPEALTKCVLIGVLATMESAHDMERLKAGVPVALHKNSDKNWYYSISGEKIASFNEGGSEPVDENGIYYGDYLYFFLLLGTMDSGTYSSILLRTGDLIEANMQKMGSDKGFDLSKARCYFSINADLKVKPLFLDIPIAHSMQEIDVNTMTGASGWCTYHVDIVRGYS